MMIVVLKDWEEYLISTGVPFAYAYHDKDKTEIGEPKKPHYHVVICFDGPITYHNVIGNYINKVGAANGVVQPVGSVRGIVRYFCHVKIIQININILRTLFSVEMVLIHQIIFV